MKNISAKELMGIQKLVTINQSKKYGSISVPTMLCFEYCENGDICIYTDGLCYLRSFTDVKDFIGESGYFPEYMFPLYDETIKNLSYDISSFNANTLLKEFEDIIEEWNFPHAKYFKGGGNHYFWVGYHIDRLINTAEDAEQYCYNFIIESIEQLEKNYLDELFIQKGRAKGVLTEKITELVPYWGEFGFDGLYINSRNRTDLNEGYFLSMSPMSLEETPFFENEPYQMRSTKLIFLLYRVCARLEKYFTSPIVAQNCFYYPCIHDNNERFIEEHLDFARKYLDLSTQEYWDEKLEE